LICRMSGRSSSVSMASGGESWNESTRVKPGSIPGQT
jgi:hypothetical protein